MLDAMDTPRNKKVLAPERAEPQRSGNEMNGGANNRAADHLVPEPEVSARSKRRRFTATYKACIVEEAQRCAEPVARGT